MPTGALKRGVRVGVLMACIPGIPWAIVALLGTVGFLTGGDAKDAVRDLWGSGILVGGSLAAGALIGLVIGGGLTLASRAISRPWGLAVIGAFLGGVAFAAEILVVTLGSDGGYAEILTTLLAWPGMVAVAAVHSADVVGLTRKRAWLWSPN